MLYERLQILKCIELGELTAYIVRSFNWAVIDVRRKARAGPVGAQMHSVRHTDGLIMAVNAFCMWTALPACVHMQGLLRTASDPPPSFCAVLQGKRPAQAHDWAVERALLFSDECRAENLGFRADYMPDSCALKACACCPHSPSPSCAEAHYLQEVAFSLGIQGF